MTKTTPHDALIYTMVAMSAADRKMTDSELERISEIVRFLPLFRDFDRERLVAISQACSEILADEHGLDRLLELIAAALPKKLHETAYALALEVAAADLSAPAEEIRLLELIANALNLDKLVTAALERGVKARHQTL